MIKKICFVVTLGIVSLSTALLISSCTRSEDATTPIGEAAPLPPPQAASAPPTTGGSGAAGEDTPAPTAVHGGNADFSTVVSLSPCRAGADCTFTKYANTPRRASDCTCQAACEPFVVNATVAEQRKSSNEKLCSVNDWFGRKCPAPECNFIEFDNFECRKGLCVGIDLNGR